MQLHIKLVVIIDNGFNIIQQHLYEKDSNANEHSQKKHLHCSQLITTIFLYFCASNVDKHAPIKQITKSSKQ